MENKKYMSSQHGTIVLFLAQLVQEIGLRDAKPVIIWRDSENVLHIVQGGNMQG